MEPEQRSLLGPGLEGEARAVREEGRSLRELEAKPTGEKEPLGATPSGTPEATCWGSWGRIRYNPD